MKLLILLSIAVAVAVGEEKYYDTEACVQFFSGIAYRDPLYHHCTNNTGCMSVWEDEIHKISSLQLYNNVIGITLYDDWGCKGSHNYYASSDVCVESLGKFCNRPFDKKTLSFRLSFYEYPFEASDPHGIRNMRVARTNAASGFARCVQYSRYASNYSLRYCDGNTGCGRMPDSWGTNDVSSIWFDGLVAGTEVFESSDCTGSSNIITSDYPYSVYQSTKNISNVPIRSFRIQSTPDISEYIGNSIYYYKFRIDETDFPSTTEILKIEIEKAPEFSKSIAFKILSKIPKMGEALAVGAALENMFSPDVEGEWKKQLLEKIPEAIDAGRAKDAFDLIQSNLMTINDNIRLFKSPNLTEDGLRSINLIMNNNLGFVVNYMLTSEICKKFPLHFINPIQVLATLVEIHYHLIEDNLRTNANVLLNNTIRLINKYHDLGIVERFRKIDFKYVDETKVNKVQNAPYTEYSTYFSESKRIDCMPDIFPIHGRDCIVDKLADEKICAHIHAEPCHEAYAKLVKWRFEQAYAPILETSERILSLAQNDSPVYCSCSYSNSIMKY